MLCGIGGKTIAEAQQSISHREFLQWCQYRMRRGTLHPSRQVNQAIARISSMLANYLRDSKLKPEPFSPFDFLPFEDEPEISLEEAMENWK